MPNHIKWSWNPFQVWAELKKPDPTLREQLEWKRDQLQLAMLDAERKHRLQQISDSAILKGIENQITYLENHE